MPAHARPGPAVLPHGTRLVFALMLVLGLVASGAVVATPEADAKSRRVHAQLQLYPALKYDSRGLPVVWLQAKLRVQPRSGWFGPMTKAAVQRFQKRQGLAATGVVNHATWRKLGIPYNAAAAAARARAAAAKARASRASVRAGVPGTAAFGSRLTSVAATTASGARYRYGGNGPSEFDCSGYVGSVVRQATGRQLPRTSAAIRSATKRISSAQLRPGDLVFVHSGSRVTHVAIYAGSGSWWEASNPRTGVGKHRAWSSSVSYGRL